MSRTARSSLALIALALLSAVRAGAEVRLHPLFTDHAVLQQGMSVPVWGWADADERVTVEYAGQKVSANADAQGRWRIRLSSLAASAVPSTLRVIGKNTVEVQDVVVGEVWVASGQSNMEWPLRDSANPEPDIASAANANIRLFTVPKLRAYQPVQTIAAAWAPCTPDAARNFSAVAYYFGRDLQKARSVPVGLIHTSWGGSPAEVWMSDDALRAHPAYVRDVLDVWPLELVGHLKRTQDWEKARDAAKAKGENFTQGRPYRPWQPSELYNGMIAPLIPYAIKGAIWYQGESNAGRAWQYRSLFADMIRNWRHDWGQGNFTFLAVQLAPWDANRRRSLEEITAKPVDSSWAELREAQSYAAEVLPKVGVAVITDVGDKDDVHPTKKQPVGARLALLARKIAYHESITSHGPLYNSHRISGNKIVVNFKGEAAGLEVKGDKLTGFSIAGKDGKFIWANAQISGPDNVIVSSPQVPHPVAARYGWADYPVVNLYNSEGLPASPFRTDHFNITTQPKN
jgi:sialate O-acetylesterase